MITSSSSEILKKKENCSNDNSNMKIIHKLVDIVILMLYIVYIKLIKNCIMKITKLTHLFDETEVNDSFDKNESDEKIDTKEIIGGAVLMIVTFALMYGMIWLGAALGLN